MFGIGMTEVLVILVVGLLVLGPKRLPELARSLGRGLAEFRRASQDMRREFLDVQDEIRRDPTKEGEAPAATAAVPGESKRPPELAADAADAQREPGAAVAAAGNSDRPAEKTAENAGG